MTTPIGIVSKRVITRRNPDARKGKARKRIGGYYTAVRRIADQMNFSGTRLAFNMLLARLVALRNGVDSAKTLEDIQAQVDQAQDHHTSALEMRTWSPGNFAEFYREMRVEAPSSLGDAVRRKKRPMEVSQSRAKKSSYDGTEPGENRFNPDTDQESENFGANSRTRPDPVAEAFQALVDAAEAEAVLLFLAMNEARRAGT